MSLTKMGGTEIKIIPPWIFPEIISKETQGG
jgi:hypothetical protein